MSSKNNWIFKEEVIKNCLSVRNGMKYNEVEVKRNIACRFISKVGKEFKLPQRGIATATMYFHRFSIFGDFSKYNVHDVATTCVFLASKVEESPIRLSSCICCAYYFKYDGKKKLDPKTQTDEYNAIRSNILKIEMLLLRILCYDLTIDHPYQYILKLTQKLSLLKKFDNRTERELSQFAWNFINDSLSLTLMLRFKPDVIAQSAIYLAAKKKSLEISWSDIEVHINTQAGDQETPDHYKVMYEIIAIYDKNQGQPNTPSTPSNSHVSYTPQVNQNMGVERISSPPTRDWTSQPSPAPSKPSSPITQIDSSLPNHNNSTLNQSSLSTKPAAISSSNGHSSSNTTFGPPDSTKPPLPPTSTSPPTLPSSSKNSLSSSQGVDRNALKQRSPNRHHPYNSTTFDKKTQRSSAEEEVKSVN